MGIYTDVSKHAIACVPPKQKEEFKSAVKKLPISRKLLLFLMLIPGTFGLLLALIALRVAIAIFKRRIRKSTTTFGFEVIDTTKKRLINDGRRIAGNRIKKR